MRQGYVTSKITFKFNVYYPQKNEVMQNITLISIKVKQQKHPKIAM